MALCYVEMGYVESGRDKQETIATMLFPRTLRLRGFDAGPADFHAFSSDTASI